MGLREIRHQVARLCWRLLVGQVDGVPEWNQICELDRQVRTRDWEKSEGCNRRLGVPDEVQAQDAASFAPAERRADVPANKCISANDVAIVLGPNSNATVSN